jgi:hypothetical protein
LNRTQIESRLEFARKILGVSGWPVFDSRRREQ